MVNKKELRLFLQHKVSDLLKQSHHVGGSPAARDNKIQIIAFKTAWTYLSSDLLIVQEIDYFSIKAKIENFILALDSDIIDLLNICQFITDFLLQTENLQLTTWTTFKQLIHDAFPDSDELIVRLLSPINKLLCKVIDTTDVEPEALRLCLQFLRYGRKLHLKSIGLEEATLSAYLDCEDRVARLEFVDDTDLLKGLNKILRKWLRKLDLRDLVPNHGNGSVAEGKLTLYEKYKRLETDLMLRVVLQYDVQSYYSIANGANYFGDMSRPDETSLVRVSRTIFVPKTFSKLRTISMEPCTLQYWQQAIMKKLYDYISSHKYLRWCIQLEDQDYNKRMARRGSIDGSLATIDLSAASDSVSWSLVKRIFHRTPLLKWFYATRSKETKLPNGKTIALAKFAPMGSALCFPVQCLIFAAVVEYCSALKCTQQSSEYPGFAVFGDDIIVATGVVNDVITALNALGFVVNKSKSFTSGNFRESCGGDYYKGEDVSSIYYKFRIEHKLNINSQWRLSPGCYAAVTSTINLCAMQGLWMLRGFFLNLIKKYYPYFTDSPEESPSIYSPNPTNFHAKRRARWHEDYQCWVASFCTLITESEHHSEQDDDDIAYLVKLGQMAMRRNSRVTTAQEGVRIYLHGSSLRLGVKEREIVIEQS